MPPVNETNATVEQIAKTAAECAEQIVQSEASTRPGEDASQLLSPQANKAIAIVEELPGAEQGAAAELQTLSTDLRDARARLDTQGPIEHKLSALLGKLDGLLTQFEALAARVSTVFRKPAA